MIDIVGGFATVTLVDRCWIISRLWVAFRIALVECENVDSLQIGNNQPSVVVDWKIVI